MSAICARKDPDPVCASELSQVELLFDGSTVDCVKLTDQVKHFGGLREVWLDNNLTERSLRGPVVGRRNHFGSKSKRGTNAAAILYSLTETAKLIGLDPALYLATAAKRAIENPGLVTLPAHLLG